MLRQAGAASWLACVILSTTIIGLTTTTSVADVSRAVVGATADDGFSGGAPVMASLELDLPETGDIHEQNAPQLTKPKTKSIKPSRYVTLTIGGDLGFGGSKQPVVATAGVRHGRRYPFAQLTRGIRPLLNSDLAFANLETVVTSTNKLSAIGKAFNFRMHPAGVRHLVKAGFNVLSTANNHAIDYGTSGMRDTIEHMSALRSAGLLASHGVAASTADMFEPAEFKRRGASFALAAIGIGGRRATVSSPGQIHPRSKEDFDRITAALGRTNADYRMLSVHYGQELQVRPDQSSRAKLAGFAVADRNIDLVIGHHAHVPAGVQRVGNGIVFYGLGNLLHLGMQDMGKFNECRDFGLMARLHLVSDVEAEGRLVAKAIEIFALRDMHLEAKMRRGAEGRRRVDVINHLGSELNDGRGTGVQFMPRQDGSGLYCAPGAANLGGAVGEHCKQWQAPSPPKAARRRQLANACRYMRKQSSGAKIVKLRGSVKPIRSKKRRRSYARSAFSPRD